MPSVRVHDISDPTPVPALSGKLASVVNPLYRFFDWLFQSRFNPLYRTGTLAAGFLFVLMITSLYLSFFYSVSQPYESVLEVEGQVWLGRWIRGLHRYSTIGCVLAVFLHVVQLLVQGKCWGPRLLAWLSGVLLYGFLMLAAWTGYVMAWDTHGQKVALAGAKMLALIPALRELLEQSFNGTSPLPPGFFFMNLFLHIAIPLGMIFFLWVHTARLSRSVWMPKRSLGAVAVLALLILAILFPPPLLGKADLLQLVGRVPLEVSTGFWIPVMDFVGVPALWLILTVLGLLLTLIPWWWRPRAGQERALSRVDVDKCTGCMQCVHDCPYEAIHMLPRADGRRLVAEVISQHCVSCGICAASCGDYAIGPEGRNALDQMNRAQATCEDWGRSRGELDVVLVGCSNNPRMREVMEEIAADDPKVAVYPVECCGCLHSDTLEVFLKHAQGLALIGCPARNCFNRDGGDLLAERIYEKRVPFLHRSIDRNRVLIAAFSEAEAETVRSSLQRFRGTLKRSESLPQQPLSFPQIFRAALALCLLTAMIGGLGQVWVGTSPETALVRVAGMLASSSKERCRAPNAEEVAQLPQHMRPKEICERVPLTYRVTLAVDKAGEPLRFLAGSRTQRLDRNIFLNWDTAVPAGAHSYVLNLETLENEHVVATTTCNGTLALQPGTIALFHYLPDSGQLQCPVT